jgi:hypothetical protein
MIAALVALLARWGVAERLRRPLALAALALAAVLVLSGSWAAWLHFHDRKVIETHETKRALGEATAAIESEHRATSQGAKRDEARAAASDQSNAAMKEAEDANPEAARAPAGPVSRAAARRFSVQP